MNRSRAFAAASAAALALLGASGAGAATSITSTFDDDAEGWRFGAHDSAGRQDVTYDAATGSIVKEHGFGDWGFVAPAEYLGDMSDYIGGALDFELATNRDPYSNRPLVILKGANNQRIFSRWDDVPGPKLTPLSVSLTAANFYTGSIADMRAPVSQELFASIMADLEFIMILGDWSSSRDTVRLDNVTMTSAAVPEPATWALMIGGFGLAGSMLRQRRRLQPA